MSSSSFPFAFILLLRTCHDRTPHWTVRVKATSRRSQKQSGTSRTLWIRVAKTAPDCLYLYSNMKNKLPLPHLFWRRQWHPTPVLLPGKSHGRRSLVGCSPWGRKSRTRLSDFTFTFLFSCTGEGNGNTLQYSCLENPRDDGAWWAAVYGVPRSWTRLKRLSIA